MNPITIAFLRGAFALFLVGSIALAGSIGGARAETTSEMAAGRAAIASPNGAAVR